MIILIVCYHVALMSDFVPSSEVKFKESVGLSMVLVISITALTILCSILYDLALNFIKWLKKKYYRRQFKKDQIKAVKNKAL